MMDWLKGLADDTRKAVEAQVSRFKNREFMEATVAGCALVAAADGTIKPEEKQKMIGFIKLSKELRVFSTAEVISAFKDTVDTFDFDFEIGRMDALKIISRLKKNPDAARVMVRVCCIIGAADGNFDDDEKKVVRDICKTLDLPPTEFDL